MLHSFGQQVQTKKFVREKKVLTGNLVREFIVSSFLANVAQFGPKAPDGKVRQGCHFPVGLTFAVRHFVRQLHTFAGFLQKSGSILVALTTP